MIAASTVFEGSNATLTRRYYAALEACGPLGHIAACLMRACKASTRAKRYHGRVNGSGPRFRDLAYDTKQRSLIELATALAHDGTLLYGWRRDPGESLNAWVLYVELVPEGQVSFHSPMRGAGPEYTAPWDGTHTSTERILALCDRVLLTSQQRTLFVAGAVART